MYAVLLVMSKSVTPVILIISGTLEVLRAEQIVHDGVVAEALFRNQKLGNIVLGTCQVVRKGGCRVPQNSAAIARQHGFHRKGQRHRT